jgi:hypothetical protein
MDPLSSIRRIGVITALTVFATLRVNAQEPTPNRFGLGVTALAGWFSTQPAAFMGAEGFVRIAGGKFWSTRIDGAMFTAFAPVLNVGCVTPYPAPACDTRTLGRLGSVIATLVLGAPGTSGLRPIYGLLGAGIEATRWGGGFYRPATNSGLPTESGVGAGPTLGVYEAGFGSEFRLLGGNRIELRVQRTSPAPPSGNRAVLGPIGASFTIGRVW